MLAKIAATPPIPARPNPGIKNISAKSKRRPITNRIIVSNPAKPTIICPPKNKDREIIPIDPAIPQPKVQNSIISPKKPIDNNSGLTTGLVTNRLIFSAQFG